MSILKSREVQILVLEVVLDYQPHIRHIVAVGVELFKFLAYGQFMIAS